MEKILREFVEFAEGTKLPLEGIAVGDEKQVLFEHHFVPDLTRNIYSHTKSFMTTAVGLAISDGKLNLDDSLAEMFADKAPEEVKTCTSENGETWNLYDIKLRHLLTMSSGFGKEYLMSASRRAGVGVPDYMKYMLSQEVIEKPGERFQYSTADSILAGRMVEKVVGVRMSEYLFDRILNPMGIGFPIWENCPQGHPVGGAGMYLKLTDMMKLGQLYLADGKWNGQQLLDPAWIKEASSKQIETPCVTEWEKADYWRCGYGYQFWMSPYEGSYRADGAFGQVTTVLPVKGLVVSFQCPEVGNLDLVKKELHERVFTQL